MSEAIEGAEVMVYAVTEKYKESANCRMEANYAHQQELDMIPLMMQKEYSPKGYGGNDRLPWAPLYLCSRGASWLTSR